MLAAMKRWSGIPMERGEEEKVMEEKPEFSWEEKIHHMGPVHPDIPKYVSWSTGST